MRLTGIGKTRSLTHAGLFCLTSSSIYLTRQFIYPYADWQYILTIACGYLALALIVVTLSIGTVPLFYQRRNPVNNYFRRDVGIWAAITGIIHVIFGLTLHFGGDIILYFFRPDSLTPRLDRTGIGNDLGAIATVVLIVLLVTSNDYSLKRLKGKRWKWLQRFNYLLAALVIVHTLVYQGISRREFIFRDLTLLLIMILLVAQAVGFVLYRSRQARNPMTRSGVKSTRI